MFVRWYAACFLASLWVLHRLACELELWSAAALGLAWGVVGTWPLVSTLVFELTGQRRAEPPAVALRRAALHRAQLALVAAHCKGTPAAPCA